MTNFYPTNFFPKTSVANGVVVVNLTPHAITVILPHKGDNNDTLSLDASGYQVCVPFTRTSGGSVGAIGDWIEMFDRDTVGEVVLIDNATKEVICPLSDIPERDDMVLLVSGMVGSHLVYKGYKNPLTANLK